MRSLRLIPLLAGAAAVLFITGCTDSAAPDVLAAADAEVLASRPGGPPDKGPAPEPDDPAHYDAYFSAWDKSDTEDPDFWGFWTATYPVDAGIATMVPLCFGDGGWCVDRDRIFHGTWTTVVDEVPDYHRSHKKFNMHHRLDIYQGPGWYGADDPVRAVHVGGFTTSNSVVCKALPCSTSGLRLLRKDWVPLEGEGLITSFDDGVVNLTHDSELIAENGVVVFRARNSGIFARAVFSWTAP
jgi:hypothetical protein